MLLCTMLADIDECARDIHNCDSLANCNNTMGSYDCTCIDGYDGDGFVGMCMSKFVCCIAHFYT